MYSFHFSLYYHSFVLSVCHELIITPLFCLYDMNLFLLVITQYGSTVYLGMTQVVSDQFQHIENTRRSITAKCGCKEQKEHYSLTK